MPRNMMTFMQSLSKQTDTLLSFAVLMIVLVMLMPLPSMLLDLLLVVNITLAILILLVSLNVLKPLDFSVFPVLLLLVTLFRLALNVASTRLILLHGSEGESAAGHVIEGFGLFVVGGNAVVGLIIFLILVLINFVVITKGSTRIAEVAARFTLDSMPGKQMAIDADLNAGLIDEDEARKRRSDVSQEADFYGSMDGASKFVRGDAVAGLIITAINLFGGFLIGSVQQGMDFSEAVTTYSILTVGDGLVTQIPALLVSTAAGIIITRSSYSSDLQGSLLDQFVQSPRVFLVASIALFLLSMVPGLPFVPFALMAAGMGLMAWHLWPNEQQLVADQSAEEQQPATVEDAPLQIADWIRVEPICLELGYGLLELAQDAADGQLLKRVQGIRKQVADDVGFVIPPVHVTDNVNLAVHDYRFLIRGAEVAKASIKANHLLAIQGGSVFADIDGEATTEPAFGLPAQWIPAQQQALAEQQGYTVVDPATMMVTHLSEVLHKHVHEVLDRAQVQALLDALGEQYPKVVEHLLSANVTVSLVQKVLRRLLAEWVSIKDLLLIMETIADTAEQSQDDMFITEKVRERLGRTIIQPYVNASGEIEVLTFQPDVENAMVEFLSQQQDAQLPWDPEHWQRLLIRLSQVLSEQAMETPILLCLPILRPFLAREIARHITRMKVISVNEVPPNIMLRSLHAVGVS